MSARATDDVGNLVRRLSRLLNRKVSDVLMLLVNRKTAGSLGAVAGFAIAVVFAWKFLRSPPGIARRNAQKRRITPSTSQPASGFGSSSEGLTPVLEMKVSGAAEAISAPIQLRPGQIVKKKLSGCRKMTCQLLGVILEEKNPEELQIVLAETCFRPSVVEVLLEITKYCDLYLMETVLDDESEKRVLSALENAGLFQTGGLIKDKILFCSTEGGRTSFVRQLEADWHIDSNLDIISQLSRFIRHQLFISPMEPGQIAPNVLTSASLEQYFA
ncbi:peroxisome biogenesis protein 22-like [Phoenix dactylifera]|uniref:Peroxisome biogenesis protein 22-like n=1 Tax=Phoenix dactylifera TaxID=42345 RepID=A0A8B8J032_PHODC|nr:peroxisome biogenesis protein 22-like [Phoenix dactylifera]